jgi:nucleotide-binding universal stress UspA family protein
MPPSNHRVILLLFTETPASQAAVRQEAKELMHFIQERALAVDPNRDISIIVEFVAGEITHTVERLIALYRPDSLIVGTRGQRSVLQTLGTALQLNKVGSVSRWCLSHSPVPVIVVRPESKMKKEMQKRKANPKRGTMFAYVHFLLSLCDPYSSVDREPNSPTSPKT